MNKFNVDTIIETYLTSENAKTEFATLLVIRPNGKEWVIKRPSIDLEHRDRAVKGNVNSLMILAVELFRK